MTTEIPWRLVYVLPDIPTDDTRNMKVDPLLLAIPRALHAPFVQARGFKVVEPGLHPTDEHPRLIYPPGAVPVQMKTQQAIMRDKRTLYLFRKAPDSFKPPTFTQLQAELGRIPVAVQPATAHELMQHPRVHGQDLYIAHHVRNNALRWPLYVRVTTQHLDEMKVEVRNRWLGAAHANGWVIHWEHSRLVSAERTTV